MFEAIEQLDAVRLLKSSFIVYPLINALHIAAIGGVFTSVLLLDLGILGAVRAARGDGVRTLMRRVALTAFAVAVASGVLLFSVRATHYADFPIFLVKMMLIALAGLNFGVFLILHGGGVSGVATSGARLSALISILLWSAVLICGRLIGFV